MSHLTRLALLSAIMILNFMFISSCLAAYGDTSKVVLNIEDGQRGVLKAYVFRDGIKDPISVTTCGERCEFEARKGDQVFLDLDTLERHYKAVWGGLCAWTTMPKCYFIKKDTGVSLVSLRYQLGNLKGLFYPAQQ